MQEGASHRGQPDTEEGPAQPPRPPPLVGQAGPSGLDTKLCTLETVLKCLSSNLSNLPSQRALTRH